MLTEDATRVLAVMRALYPDACRAHVPHMPGSGSGSYSSSMHMHVLEDDALPDRIAAPAPWMEDED